MAEVFARMPKLEEVILYGIRAMGNYRAGSDIDLALKGVKLDINDLLKIAADLDELDLPYSFDLLLFDNAQSPDLLEHIRTAGTTIYRRTSALRMQGESPFWMRYPQKKDLRGIYRND